jgi:NhaP-type Na+/H+ or K+/H+ antiporter
MVSTAIALSGVVALGALAQWLAWRVSLPAILPLLIIGFLVGPVFEIFRPTDFMGTDLLFPIVSLAVGLILFEGGLTLQFSEITDISNVVRRLISVGAIITWLSSAVAAYLLTDLSVQLSLLFGALIIVTGPTVIGPLLRNVRPTPKVSSILKWEGILIDPVGALIAVLMFEFLIAGSQSEAWEQIAFLLFSAVFVGTAMGFIGGFALAYILKRHLVPEYLVNVVSLAMVFGCFALANELAHESGLLTTTIMGIIVANRKVPRLEELLSFKETLSILFISLLFIVLAANIQLGTFLNVLTWKSFLLVAIIMVIVRPVNIFASSIGSNLSFKEKLFLSSIAPRGIVAASVTSLFAFELVHQSFVGAEALEPLVFLVIVVTVVLNSLLSKPVANALGVAEPDPQGFLILGAHDLAREIAHFLQQEGLIVTMADTNWANVAAARVEGLNAYYGSLLSDYSDDEVRLSGIGRLLALTSNDEANALTALKFARDFGDLNVFQLEPSQAGSTRQALAAGRRGRLAFTDSVTHEALETLFQKGYRLKKTELTEQFDFADFRNYYGYHLCMFIIQNGKLQVMSEGSPEPKVGTTIVSLVLEPEAIAAIDRSG